MVPSRSLSGAALGGCLLTVLVLSGCGSSSTGASQPGSVVGREVWESDCERTAREAKEELSWIGDRPREADAAQAYDRVRVMLEARRDSEEFREIGMLAFHAETIPAMLVFFRKGNARQLRAAFLGLRGLVDGVACSWYLPPEYVLEDYQRRLLPLWAEASRMEILRESLHCLPDPSRKIYSEVLDRLESHRPRREGHHSEATR